MKEISVKNSKELGNNPSKFSFQNLSLIKYRIFSLNRMVFGPVYAAGMLQKNPFEI